MLDPDAPATRRAIAAGTVVLLHVLLVAGLAATGDLVPVLRAIVPARLILPDRPPLPEPPMVPLPKLADAAPVFVPAPEIAVTAPPSQPRAPRAITRAAPATPSGGHFGAASDAGLGLDVAASGGGGAGTRGTLAGFEASVRARVLAEKHQPSLAADLRNTCVVNFTVRVSRGGGLAGYSIDPCAVQAINQAARSAIQQAAPFPAPPDLGAATYEVHGSLIFGP